MVTSDKWTPWTCLPLSAVGSRDVENGTFHCQYPLNTQIRKYVLVESGGFSAERLICRQSAPPGKSSNSLRVLSFRIPSTYGGDGDDDTKADSVNAEGCPPLRCAASLPSLAAGP